MGKSTISDFKQETGPFGTGEVYVRENDSDASTDEIPFVKTKQELVSQFAKTIESNLG